MLFVHLYLIALYVRPQDWAPAFLGLPTAYILIPAAMLFAFRNYMGDRERFRIPQNGLLPIYLLVIAFSTWLNVDGTSALEQFEIFLKRIVVFFMIAWLATSAERLRQVVWMVLALSLFLVYQGYLQATEGAGWGGVTPHPNYAEVRIRWHGDWDGPNVLGLLFVIAAGLALEYVFGPYAFVGRCAGALLLASFLGGIYLTNSRGAVLAFGCAVLFYFKDRFRGLFALGTGVAALAALLVYGPSRMSELSTGEASARERTWLWEQGLGMLRQNPLFGVGRGEFIERADPQLLAHSNYVQNFAETGLIGFFCFLAVLWFCFRGCLLVAEFSRTSQPALASFARMMTTVLVGYMAATFFVVMELDLLYFVLGLSAAVYLVARKENPAIPPLRFTRFDLAVIVGGMFVIIALVWLVAVTEII